MGIPAAESRPKPWGQRKTTSTEHAVRLMQDGVRPVVLLCLNHFLSHGIECLVPGYSFKLTFAPLADTLHRTLDPIWVVERMRLGISFCTRARLYHSCTDNPIRQVAVLAGYARVHGIVRFTGYDHPILDPHLENTLPDAMYSAGRVSDSITTMIYDFCPPNPGFPI